MGENEERTYSIAVEGHETVWRRIKFTHMDAYNASTDGQVAVVYGLSLLRALAPDFDFPRANDYALDPPNWKKYARLHNASVLRIAANISTGEFHSDPEALYHLLTHQVALCGEENMRSVFKSRGFTILD